jgi:hypothetical protein
MQTFALNVLLNVVSSAVSDAIRASGRAVWRGVQALWARRTQPRVSGTVWHDESGALYWTLRTLAQHAALTGAERQPNQLSAR